MAYLSQILKTPVRDSADRWVGKLVDLAIVPQAGEYAPLQFLKIEAKRGRGYLCIPYQYVENLSRDGIDLKAPLHKIPVAEPEGNFVFLDHDVLDQQIVDVGGARVVRVNDLRIGLFEEKMCVLGIDISLKGIMRRLGIAGLDIFNFWKVNLIDWRKSQPVKGMVKLDTSSSDLVRLHPADLANIIEDLSIKQGSKLVKSLDEETAAKVFEEIDPKTQRILVSRLGSEEAIRIMSRMSTDEIVDLLKVLPKDDAARLLGQFKSVKIKKLEKLIKYDDDTAGGLMTTDFVSARPDWTVQQTIEEIRRLSPLMRSILYVYIIDDDGVFKGSVSLRRLLTDNPLMLLKDLVKRPPASATLHLRDKIDHIINVVTKYDLYVAAVLNDEGKLVGVLSTDDVMRHLAPRA
jgi:magnesium transporter